VEWARRVVPASSHNAAEALEMNLPQSFRRHATAVLTKYPEIAHQWSIEPDFCVLSISAATPNGFDIRCEVEPNAITVCWGNWHTRFEPTESSDALIEDLFGLVRDMLGPDMRIRELYAGARPYRGVLESFDGTHWSPEQEMGLVFWNYFAKRSVRTYTNSILPGRMSSAGL
jgi:hypothetical protein